MVGWPHAGAERERKNIADCCIDCRPSVLPWSGPRRVPNDHPAAASDRAAADYTKALAGAQGKPLSADRLNTINQQLALAERKLLNAQGLPRRPWMQHLLYAPGWYTGYSAKTMPGVREAIEEGRYVEAEAQVLLVAQALQDEAAWIEQLVKELGG